MLKDFFEEYKWDGRPWVLAGMGPSFSKVHDYDLSKYNVMGINKVVREIPVDIASIIDWYIIDRVFNPLWKQAKWIACPYWPHFGCRPHVNLTLKDCVERLPFKDKVLGYNLSTIPIQLTKSPVIKAVYFTAEASLNLIAHLGCKKVLAVGIDGGKERNVAFSDHGPCDPRGFDLQWANIARTIVLHSIDYSNLDGSPLNPKLEKAIEEVKNAKCDYKQAESMCNSPHA